MKIAVVGGGVVGLSCALALAEHGLKVVLFDPSSGRNAASWGNAGHIATEQVAPLASFLMLRTAWRRRFAAGGALDLPYHAARHWLPFAARMARAALPRSFASGRTALGGLLHEAMPAWQRLGATLHRPDLIRAQGHYVLWEAAATARAGRSAWMAADIGRTHVADATSAELGQLGGVTSAPVAGALRFTGSGQITDLDELAHALEATLLRLGGRIDRGMATLHVADGRASVRGEDADLVLVAAGVRSGAIVAAAGHRAPLIAERGYHVRAPADDWPALLPPVVWEDRSLIVTRYARSVQLASFVELGHPDGPPDPRKWERLERHAAELGLPLRGPFSRWMGSRPTLPDYLPAIGRSRRAPNLLYAFGHQHLGLTLAPITAAIIAALAVGAPPPVDPAPFDLERFAGHRFGRHRSGGREGRA